MNPEAFDLATSQSFVSYCKEITKGNDIYRDLVNDTILILSELKAEVRNIENLGKVIAWRQYNNKWSDFNKAIGAQEKSSTSINECALMDGHDDSLESNEEKELYHNITASIEADAALHTAAGDDPTEHHVFAAYIKLGTVRAVSKHYGISKSTIGRMVKGYRERIRSKIEI